VTRQQLVHVVHEHVRKDVAAVPEQAKHDVNRYQLIPHLDRWESMSRCPLSQCFDSVDKRIAQITWGMTASAWIVS
jgi:hypothetical protein